MRVVLILFSFLYLFASVANVKYVPKNHTLYIYIKSKEHPKSYQIPNVTIDNGNIKFLKNFNYFYNGEYYVGKKYNVEFKNNLEIKPLKIEYNSKTYITHNLYYQKQKTDPLNIKIEIKSQKTHFFEIIIIFIIIYLITLVVIYNVKAYKLKSKLGYFEDDIKKFYYFLATHNYKEVEKLNKNKNIFKKSFKYYHSILVGVIWNEIGFVKFVKEFFLFLTILILVLIARAFI